MSYDQSKEYTTQLLQYKLSEIDRMPETILLVDEAQSTKADRFFWNMLLKSVVQDGHLKVGMFTSYGSAGAIPVELCSITPPILSGSSCIELERHAEPKDKQKVGLYLSENEANEIFDNKEKYPPDRPIFSNDMREYLFGFTKGHVGALTSIIDAVIKDEVCIALGQGMFSGLRDFAGHQTELCFAETPNNPRCLQGCSIP
jgi:hypothetical protein